jgi:hypothetical protein
MKDFLGVELAEGDFVAAVRPSYRDHVLGKIVAFTAKRVRVEYKLHYGTRMDTHLYHPKDLVKLEGAHLTMKLLRGEQ